MTLYTGMLMAESDERTPLLQPSPESVPSESTVGTSVTTIVRRRSSSCHISNEDDGAITDEAVSTAVIWVVVPISLLGVFVANADGSLIIASSQQIASEFDALSNASWLVTSYILAQCASQPLYGKLANIFGRKSNLVVSYVFFAVGNFLCGVGRSYGVLLAGRAISGVGGAGMTALVSIIIADIVPVRQVASWRSYVNIVATLARTMGGPVGGWICDTIDWRWCFYGQVPLTVFGLLLILAKMPNKEPDMGQDKPSYQRVDFLGAISLATTISAFLLSLDFVPKDLPFYYTLVPALVCLISGSLFYLVESRVAKEPILPLRLIIQRAPLTAYLLTGFQIAGQFAIYYSVPLYFQLSSNASVTEAGLRLIPAVVGNATAGLLSGYIISRTGRYKWLAIFSCLFACGGFVLILLRWRGNTGWPETFYQYAGGFNSGVIQSTTFVHIAASLTPEDIAIAGSTLYLAQGLFQVAGLQLATTVVHARLRSLLDIRLKDVNHKSKIIAAAISSVQSIRLLPITIKKVVVQAYLDSLRWSYALSIAFAILTLLVALSLKERKL